MFKNFLIIAYRNLRKNGSFSLINIIGLTAGLLSYLLIQEYIAFERSYDTFHHNSDRIYRLAMNFYLEGELEGQDAMTYAPVGPALVEEFPEVENFVRITPQYDRTVLQYEDQKFEIDRVFFADSSLFQLFDYSLLDGDPQTALTGPSSVVLTLSTAEKYFGPKAGWIESPVGKSIRFNRDHLLQITGILADVPANSHIKFNALLSFTSFSQFSSDPSGNWGWNDFYTYVLLEKDADIDALSSALPAFLKRHKKGEINDELIVQPLTSIHLHSNLGYEAEMNGDAKAVYFLSLVGILILLLAWINYVNLSTARARDRAGEVGIRKVVGANRRTLLAQFLVEAGLINTLAIILALLLGIFCQPLLDTLTGTGTGNYFWGQPAFWLTLPLLLLFGILLSGFYPAFVLSAMTAGKALEAERNKRARGQWLRKGLVTFQYAISVALIAGALIIFQQLRFMQQKDLGFSLQQMLVLNAPSVINNDTVFTEQMKAFRGQLAGIPGVQGMTASSAIPGKFHLDLDMNGGIYLVGQSSESAKSFTAFRIDEYFTEAYGLRPIAGAVFSPEKQSDNGGALLNRSAARLLGFDEPTEIVGKKLQYWKQQIPIVGVIEDYHHKSLRNRMEPMIIHNNESSLLYFSILTENEDLPGLNRTIAQVEKAWKQIYPDNPFNYFFLDQQFNDQYQADRIFGRIVGLFSLLAILIASLGLFGLASYAVRVRTKEIGIRKVLGAPVGHILLLLNRNFLQLLGIAFLVSVPFTYYLFSRWLENFAYQTPLYWWFFVLPCVLVLLVALVAISGQSYRIASGDPVDALRYE